MRLKRNSNPRGITIIELLVVLIVMSVLAAVLFPALAMATTFTSK